MTRRHLLQATRALIPCLSALLTTLLLLPPAVSDDGARNIVFVAGPRSHGYGSHEHHAGCLLLADRLKKAYPRITTTVSRDGWPKDTMAIEQADAIVLFNDGGGKHPALGHLKTIEKRMRSGAGLVCLHYAVEVPKGEAGQAFLDWTGGYFETFWSVNPHWKAQFRTFPEHPTSRGLQPFECGDEWYYHMRFRENMAGVTPILSAVPPEKTRQRPDGAHSGNPTVRARTGMAEHLAWARERPDKGRGFGFTGGHWHWNWANDSFRKTVLNGIAWTAHLEIPKNGVPSDRPGWAELTADLDEPPPAKFDADEVRKRFAISVESDK